MGREVDGNGREDEEDLGDKSRRMERDRMMDRWEDGQRWEGRQLWKDHRVGRMDRGWRRMNMVGR